MGEIVFWTLLRAIIILPLIYISESYIPYSVWWMGGVMLIYAGIIHPAIIHYHLFQARNQPIFEATLCSSCKHFDTTAVLCLKHDEHPTLQYLPCDGVDWQPQAVAVTDSQEED